MRLLPLIFPVIILFIFILSIYFSTNDRLNISFEKNISNKICENGQIKSCLLNGCNGITKCENNYWSPCSWEKICIPKNRIPCTEFGCTYAYKECNSCGDGYGSCVTY